MTKTFTVVQIFKDDQFVNLTKRNMHCEFDDAWEHACAIVLAETGQTPARPRLNQPLSIELPYSYVQIWAVSMPAA